MGRTQPALQLGPIPRDLDRDAPLVEVRQPDRAWEDLVLDDSVRRRLERVEEEYRNRELLARHALAPRCRLLFVGPPGCGKTASAETLAASLGLELLYARFDAIVSSYLGETAANLRRVFAFAERRNAVLFFDEFDAIAKRRDDALEVGELKRVVSGFLQILDAYPRDKLVVAATNHEGMLDEALWRRFDDVVRLERPGVDDLVRLLELRLRAVRKQGVDLAAVARDMVGLTYADAERVCHESIKSMLMSKRKELTQDVIVAELADQRFRAGIGTRGKLPTE